MWLVEAYSLGRSKGKGKSWVAVTTQRGVRYVSRGEAPLGYKHKTIKHLYTIYLLFPSDFRIYHSLNRLRVRKQTHHRINLLAVGLGAGLVPALINLHIELYFKANRPAWVGTGRHDNQTQQAR